MNFVPMLRSVALAALLSVPSLAATAATPDDQLVVGVSMVTMLSLDPSAMSGRESMEINSNIYDSLISADSSEAGVFHPRLAERWELNEARDEFTFYLRRDVKFHSGNPLTAEDFVWSVKRAFALGIGGSTVRVYGYTEDNIDEMVFAPDPYTVKLRIPRPTDPNLILDTVATNGLMMVIDSKLAMEHATNDDFGQGWLTTNSAGSGPFKLMRWQANDIVILDRVDDHWSGPANMRRVIYRHMPESQSMRFALEKGDIDVALGMAASDVQALASNDKLVVKQVPSGYMYYLAASMAEPVFQDPKVREALRYLIDYEGINETILPFYGKLHQRPLAAGLPGELPNQGYEFDPDRARALLAEAGYPDGFKTTLRVLAEAPFINIATAIQATLAQAGVEAEIITGNGDQIYGAMRERKFELLVGRGGSRTASHSYGSLLSLVYNPDNSDEAKLYTLQAWRTSYQNTEINALLDGALIEPDPEKQVAMYQRVQELYEADFAPLQVISQSFDTVVYQSDLVDYVPHHYQKTDYSKVSKNR